jgi:hypothetical protein
MFGLALRNRPATPSRPAASSRPVTSNSAPSRAPRSGPIVAVLAFGALVLAALLALAGPAVAASASLHVSPTTVAAGRTVTVSGSCEANTNGFVISEAFFKDATHEFAGLGAVAFTTGAAGTFTTHPVVAATTAPGNYVITARCGGGNLGIEAHLRVTNGNGGTPTGVPAGTGGLAATADRGPTGALVLGGAGALLVLAAGAKLLLVRRAAGSGRR